MLRLFFPLFLIFQTSLAMAYDQAFKQTEPGLTELKELPPGKLLEATGKGTYFENSNQLFSPLFRYIQQNNIAMTTPVEAHMEPGPMYFWVSSKEAEKAVTDSDNVRVLNIPKRTVAARGGRGSYSKENFEKSKDILLDWIDQQPGIEATSEPFAVYWNGPFTPWFMKNYEVMVEIRQKIDATHGTSTN